VGTLTTGAGLAFADSTTQTTGAGATTYLATESFSPTLTTTSGSFATMYTVPYTQTVASEKLWVIVSGSIYFDNGANSRMALRLNYDGNVTAEEFAIHTVVTTEHKPYSFQWKITGPASTGSKNLLIEWARVAGSANIRVDTSDSIQVMIMRVQ
jgi:hypothetical protein